MSKVVFVETTEEAKIKTRQERRENARRERDGLPTKPLTIFKLLEHPPRPRQRRQLRTKPPKELTPKEQEVFDRALKKSVTVVHEGELVDSSKEVKDNSQHADRIAKQRQKAQQRRKQLKSKE